MLRPSNSMRPAVGSSAASTSFDVVVLPQPDSPTSPSVSPAPIVKLIPSTALTMPRGLPKSEPPTGKCLRRSRTASSGLSTRGPLLERHPAAHTAVAVEALLGRLLGAAALDRSRAAGMEGASGREGREIRRVARNTVERLADAELRDRVEERLRVGMPGAVEETAHRLHLHDLARVHHADPVAHLGDDAEVVRDEDQRDAGRALEILQQIQVLELDRDVEVGGGLVGDDDTRPAGLGDGPDNPLPHAAAELVGKIPHPPLW